MIIKNKIDLEGVGPNSLNKGVMNHSLSAQISIAFFNEALNQFKDKDYFECIKSLNSAIKYNLINPTYYLFKAIVLGFALGICDFAIEEIDKALSLDPHSEKIIKLKKELLRLQFNNKIYNYFI